MRYHGSPSHSNPSSDDMYPYASSGPSSKSGSQGSQLGTVSTIISSGSAVISSRPTSCQVTSGGHPAVTASAVCRSPNIHRLTRGPGDLLLLQRSPSPSSISTRTSCSLLVPLGGFRTATSCGLAVRRLPGLLRSDLQLCHCHR
jgi:hypothetical protein